MDGRSADAIFRNVLRVAIGGLSIVDITNGYNLPTTDLQLWQPSEVDGHHDRGFLQCILLYALSAVFIQIPH